MTHAPTPPPGHLADDELAELASSWRTRAGHGDCEAFGIAHALEVELRRRTRNSYLQALPAEIPLPARPWWKFWTSPSARNGADGPMSMT